MKFSEIPGQNRVKNFLIQTVRNKRVSHAQMFTGPEGCGKLALAIAYAQYINCLQKQEFHGAVLKGDSCGTCPSCVKYQKLAHPDLHFFYPVAPTRDIKKALSSDFIARWREYLFKTNFLPQQNEWFEEIGLENKQGIINADDCNEMIRVLSYKAYEAEYKTVIIWLAEKLFHAAAPKLLKILEEPPEKTLFILISENPDLVLNTILSRTQIIKIPKRTDREIAEVLIQNYQCSEADARKIAALSEGNLRLAIHLIDQKEAENSNFITLRNWYRLCYRNEIIELTRFAEEISKLSREQQKSFLSYALRITRQCLLLHYRLTSLVKLEGEENDFVQKLTPFIHPQNAALMTEEFSNALLHLERNANSKILFMDLSLKLTRLLKKAAGKISAR